MIPIIKKPVNSPGMRSIQILRKILKEKCEENNSENTTSAERKYNSMFQ